MNNHLEDVITLTLPTKAEYIEVVRLSLYGIAVRMEFAYEDIEDMKVAVGEACNNAVLHAYEADTVGMMTVSFQMSREALTIRVKDSGKSFPYEEAAAQAKPLTGLDMDDIHAGGLGLFLMQSLMDEVSVHTDNGTEVVLTKFRMSFKHGVIL